MRIYLVSMNGGRKLEYIKARSEKDAKSRGALVYNYVIESAHLSVYADDFSLYTMFKSYILG